MQLRSLGKTGLAVSELSLGAARGAAEDAERFTATVHACTEAGINLVDTAESYDDGESERVLGRALRGHGEVIVQTKYRPYDSHAPQAQYTGTPQRLTASVEDSLRRLQRDHLDILLGHGIRSLETLNRFMHDGCYEAMQRLRDQGKVRFIGISELSEADGTHEVLTSGVPMGAFDVVLLTINFLLQTASRTLLPLCREHGVGTVVMMPLNQASRQSGLVSVPAARECVRRHIEAGNLPAEPPYTEEDLFDFLLPFSIPEAALRFVLCHDIGSCCVGMSSPERVEENVQATLPPELGAQRLARLRRLFGGIDAQIR